MNVTLQSLFSLTSFNENPSGGGLAGIIGRIFEALKAEDTKPFEPYELENFQIIKEKFRKYKEQHDCHEFAQFLINTLNEEERGEAIKPERLDFKQVLRDVQVTKIIDYAQLLDREEKKELKITTTTTSTSINTTTTTATTRARSPFFVAATPQKETSRAKVFPKNPFMGMLISSLHFDQCNHRSSTTQSFLDISLSITQRRHCTLTDCLDQFTMQEEVREVECSACEKQKGKKVLRTAKKQFKILRAPPVLCLHIRRLTCNNMYGPKKVENEVSFPFLLDIAPYCDSNNPIPTQTTKPKSISDTLAQFDNEMSFLSMSVEARLPESNRKILSGGSHGFIPNPRTSSSNGSTNGHTATKTAVAASNGNSKKTGQSHPKRMYELTSVIVHHGSHDGGHYTVYRRSNNDNDKWVYISDDVVREAEEKEVARAQAYMLYYEKRELRTPLMQKRIDVNSSKKT